MTAPEPRPRGLRTQRAPLRSAPSEVDSDGAVARTRRGARRLTAYVPTLLASRGRGSAAGSRSDETTTQAA
jgi:hypothetical protein